jgi:hypothetical protein
MTGRGLAAKTRDLIDAARSILEEIRPASVRATCYRLFVAKLIESMAKLALTNAHGAYRKRISSAFGRGSGSSRKCRRRGLRQETRAVGTRPRRPLPPFCRLTSRSEMLRHKK